MDIENQEIETIAQEPMVQNSIEDDLKAAMKAANEPKEEAKPIDENRDETGRFKTKTSEEIEKPTETVSTEKSVLEAPVSLSGAMKAKWSTLDPDVQQEWSKREADIHKMFTAHDGELRMGREMKDVIAPYMATINSEGGTPVKAVQSLLNTAYVLRTGTPQQKAALLQQFAQ